MTENQFAAYQTAKSSRPAWANALIVAAVIFIAGVAIALMSGLPASLWFFVAAGIAALVAGVLALMNVGRRA